MIYRIPPGAPPGQFPPLERALQYPDGLLAVGGDLSPARLRYAYRHGIFPWYSEGEPILWWSPDPRMVLLPERLRVTRSLRKNIRNHGFEVTLNQAFAEVVQACAHTPRPGQDGTWISPEVQRAYHALHRLGMAHSVECWRGGELVGGLYGLRLGRVFFGESMFSHASNASKVAFAVFVHHLRQWGYQLVDCQVYTEHLDSLGALMIPRPLFKQLLDQWCEQAPLREDWPQRLEWPDL